MNTDKGLDKKRVGVAILLLIWIMASLYFGGFVLAAFIGIFIFIGTQEFINIMRSKGINPPFYFIIFADFSLILLAFFRLYTLLFGTVVFFAGIAFLLILFRGKDAKINDLAMTILALFYTGVFPIHVVMIRNMDSSSFSILGQDYDIGIGLVVLMFLCVAACDIGAYYCGKLWGKRPLWKEISPKKTVEGSTGGILASIIIAVIIGYFIGLDVITSVITGILVSIFAQLGDLAESMIKREAGIKDSGTVFPGHGGVLDRSDSYILTSVAGYYYYKYFVINDISAVFSVAMF